MVARRLLACVWVLAFGALLGVGCVVVRCDCGANQPISESANQPKTAAKAVFAEGIANRRPVAFVYNGVPRVVHPHRLGPSVAKNGKVLVRCWEVRRGEAATGTWKLFEVGKAEGARLLEGTFEPAPGHAPRDRAIPKPSTEIEITKE